MAVRRRCGSRRRGRPTIGSSCLRVDSPSNRREHWEKVWGTHPPDGVSWYAPHLAESLRLILEVVPPGGRVIDVGGGASTLVDDLLDAGVSGTTVLDISDAALDVARARLDPREQGVTWLHADITT